MRYALVDRFIDGFRDIHYKNLKRILHKTPNALCKSCKTYFNFSIENYNNAVWRSWYHIRFSAAYMTEYYKIYSNIFQSGYLENCKNLCIVSVGCGAMYDFASSQYSLRDFGVPTTQMNYYGIDIVDWSCKEIESESVQYINKTIDEVNPKDFFDKIDILFLPKSLIDVDAKRMISFLKNIGEEALSSKLFFVNAIRYANGNRVTTDERYGYEIVNFLENNFGYKKINFGHVQFEDQNYRDIVPYESDENYGILQLIEEACSYNTCAKKESCIAAGQDSKAYLLWNKRPMQFTMHSKPFLYYLEKK